MVVESNKSVVSVAVTIVLIDRLLHSWSPGVTSSPSHLTTPYQPSHMEHSFAWNIQNVARQDGAISISMQS